MDISYIHMLKYAVYTVCFGILIVSLNTTFSHFSMYILRYHKMFGDGLEQGRHTHFHRGPHLSRRDLEWTQMHDSGDR